MTSIGRTSVDHEATDLELRGAIVSARIPHHDRACRGPARELSWRAMGWALLSLATWACPSPVLAQQTVTVFSTDFNSGAPSQFSGITTTEGVQGFNGVGTGTDVFAGSFLRNTIGGNPGPKTILTLSGLPTHTTIDISFLLAIIDSWDGNTGNGSPDVFNVVVDGALVFSQSFTNISWEHGASYPHAGTPAGVVLAREVQLGFTTDEPWWRDSGYHMGLEPALTAIPHTSSTVTIEWFAGGAGWQGGSDESWAIDNVQISVSSPECAPQPFGAVAW